MFVNPCVMDSTRCSHPCVMDNTRCSHPCVMDNTRCFHPCVIDRFDKWVIPGLYIEWVRVRCHTMYVNRFMLYMCLLTSMQKLAPLNVIFPLCTIHHLCVSRYACIGDWRCIYARHPRDNPSREVAMMWASGYLIQLHIIKFYFQGKRIMLGNTYSHMACLPKQCISGHGRAQCSFRGHAGHAFSQNMEEPLIEQVPKVRCGSGLKPWYPEHKVVVNDKIFIKLCKWDRSFTAFILGRSMDNRIGSGSLYFLEGFFEKIVEIRISTHVHDYIFN